MTAVERRPGPRGVRERLRRLLVMLPWLMERGEATLAEMSQRFQLSEAELVRDLEQAAMCGLPPFLDEVVDLFIDDDGTVRVGIPRFFTAPLRLTAPEGFALLAAGRLAMELPGADPGGPLGRALHKLERVLGDDGMVIEVQQPPAAGDLIEAASRSERVRITYWSASSDQVAERSIVPRLVFTDRGQWYVVADDDRSGEERIFRIDRIERWERTGEVVDQRDVTAPESDAWFDDQADLPTVVLRLQPEARWAIERLPTRSVTTDGDVTVVELVVASERWLTELLLRMGPYATVVSPPAMRGLAARAARELLAARYAATS